MLQIRKLPHADVKVYKLLETSDDYIIPQHKIEIISNCDGLKNYI